MRLLDWLVLGGSLVAVVFYGLWRGRGSDTVGKYLLAGKTMPWYAMALSIMATQASAITFISTTGQAYVDGMRFVQFYFGLPLAMIVLSATAVPIFHRAGVYTAYEYLERRFDAKTRVLVSLIFLIQRGLAVGVALYAPAVVLTVILGWPDRLTTVVMGSLVVLYTTLGGIKAVTWTDFQQMLIMMAGIVAALATAIFLLPDPVSFRDALTVAGAAGRLNAVTLRFDWNDRYNLWSGLIGGMFLALSYFGCDQSQVQRYLTGKSVAQSRLSLLFNAVAKVPMQFFILFTGALVFAFYTFEKPPVLFQPVTLERMRQQSGFEQIETRYEAAFARRREAAAQLLEARRNGDAVARAERVREYREAQRLFEETRRQAVRFAESRGISGVNDTNYIFLTFVTRYMPAGVVGLIMAAIFGGLHANAAHAVVERSKGVVANNQVGAVFCRYPCSQGDKFRIFLFLLV
ncbi:MAG: sodium:solute symporter [Bryobacteraceae bacterium]|nr:sodium:solute symporter [Bryobacteraceae bacterium]